MTSSKGIVDFEGASIAFEEEGAGEPLLLIHAANTDGRMWNRVAPSLAKSRRVMRYDLRGMGRSTMGTGAYSAWRDIGAVLDAQGIASCALVGVSAGGYCALEFALMCPQRVSALILVSAGLFEPVVPESAEHARLWAELAAAESSGDIDAMAECYARMWLDAPGRPASRVDSSVRAGFIGMAKDAFARRKELRFPQLIPNPRAMLAGMACPALVVDGELDFPEVHAFAELFGREIPGARRSTMQGVGHLPPLERPEEFCRLVESFLEEVDRKGDAGREGMAR